MSEAAWQRGPRPDVETVKRYRTIEELIPPQWSEGRVLANGIHQHYYRTGGDKPPLVLLHGIMMSGVCWLRVAKALEQDYDLILLDARGHGRSDGVEAGFSPELRAEDVAGALRELKLERPALLGHSMGAETAALVAASHPELVHAVVLEDPAWHDTPMRGQMAQSEGYRAWFNSWLAWLEQLRTLPHAEQMAAALRQMPPGSSMPEEEYVPWVDASAHLSFDLARSSMALWNQEVTPWREVVPRIACPILLMTGNKARSAVMTQQNAQEVAALWQRGRLARFEQAGHQIHVDAFEPFIAAVKGFLSEQH